MLARITGLAMTLLLSTLLPAGETDPYLWLEEVEGEKALTWVKEQNRRSTAELEATSDYKQAFDRILKIMDSEERIPSPSLDGPYVYNFWQDQSHERGILRRTSLASYRTEKPQWETVLDIDALAKADGVPYVYKGRESLEPECRLWMVALSRGGADAVLYREFDSVKKEFVGDGFSIPEAKTTVAWKDADTLWVATEFGEGSLTTSGYPRVAKEWKRGTPLADARTLYEGPVQNVGTWPAAIDTPQGRYNFIYDAPTIFTAQIYMAVGTRLVRLNVPEDALLHDIFRDHLLLSLRTDWNVGENAYKEGSLVAAPIDDLLQGRSVFPLLFEPSERVALESVSSTRDHVLMTTLDNVHSRFYRIGYSKGEWPKEEIPLPGIGTATVKATALDSDLFFFSYQDFVTPDSLFLMDEGGPVKVKALPAFFNTGGVTVNQYEAVSKDGTKIPYFVVTPKGFKADGKAPTYLYGYGGFEESEVPAYGPNIGAAWIERGGVYALANIRGGGEFGPRWHKAAMKENRMKSFDDFIAVAEDLIARTITSPRHLGIVGGSQGGLLVGGAATLRPDLFGAVVCQVPLLDMQRYSKLLAGASWMAEYGDPEIPEEWAYIQTWSPYHLVRKDVRYPKIFFWTTTRDDRVHPGHARKMVAKMMDMGHPVYYFENIEGGHGSGSVNRQKAYVRALEFSYLWKMLR